MIKRLDEKTINLISAGEVIESPSDIIKELIENSIDANSDSIVLKIKSSGIDLIEIKDNGDGISKDDLELCTQRHTTSKLEKIDDLYSIDTLGFRGEALASINAISQMEINTSKTNNGKAYCLNNEKIIETSSTKGTTIKIENIFFNVPVRKKFLKSKATEFSKLYTTFLEFVIQYPNIRFQFISEKKNETFQKASQEERFIQVFGKDILTKTKIINSKKDFLTIKGIITKPDNYFFYPNNFLYINKRAVYSTQINKLILKCYKDYLMIQQKPFFVLFIELNPKTIDINVHPKKRHIKIQNEYLFNSELKDIIENTLFSKAAKETTETKTHYFLDDKAPPLLKDNIKEPNHFQDIQLASENKSTQNYLSNIEKKKKITLNNYEIKEIICQIFDTFIVCKTNEGILLIDQHAAEERINLEKNRIAYLEQFKIQNLVIPKKLDFISHAQKEFIQKNKKLLRALGFFMETKNDNIYLTAIPEFLKHYFDHHFFLEMLQDIENTNDFDTDTIKQKILKLKSCKESIKANEPLTISQMYLLIEELDTCKDKWICAHGRPTFLLLNKKELEKMFKRSV